MYVIHTQPALLPRTVSSNGVIVDTLMVSNDSERESQQVVAPTVQREVAAAAAAQAAEAAARAAEAAAAMEIKLQKKASREVRERRRQERLDAIFAEEARKAAEKSAARAAALAAAEAEEEEEAGDDAEGEGNGECVAQGRITDEATADTGGEAVNETTAAREPNEQTPVTTRDVKSEAQSPAEDQRENASDVPAVGTSELSQKERNTEKSRTEKNGEESRANHQSADKPSGGEPVFRPRDRGAERERATTSGQVHNTIAPAAGVSDGAGDAATAASVPASTGTEQAKDALSSSTFAGSSLPATVSETSPAEPPPAPSATSPSAPASSVTAMVSSSSSAPEKPPNAASRRATLPLSFLLNSPLDESPSSTSTSSRLPEPRVSPQRWLLNGSNTNGPCISSTTSIQTSTPAIADAKPPALDARAGPSAADGSMHDGPIPMKVEDAEPHVEGDGKSSLTDMPDSDNALTTSSIVMYTGNSPDAPAYSTVAKPMDSKPDPSETDTTRNSESAHVPKSDEANASKTHFLAASSSVVPDVSTKREAVANVSTDGAHDKTHDMQGTPEGSPPAATAPIPSTTNEGKGSSSSAASQRTSKRVLSVPRKFGNEEEGGASSGGRKKEAGVNVATGLAASPKKAAAAVLPNAATSPKKTASPPKASGLSKGSPSSKAAVAPKKAASSPKPAVTSPKKQISPKPVATSPKTAASPKRPASPKPAGRKRAESTSDKPTVSSPVTTAASAVPIMPAKPVEPIPVPRPELLGGVVARLTYRSKPRDEDEAEDGGDSDEYSSPVGRGGSVENSGCDSGEAEESDDDDDAMEDDMEDEDAGKEDGGGSFYGSGRPRRRSSMSIPGKGSNGGSTSAAGSSTACSDRGMGEMLRSGKGKKGKRETVLVIREAIIASFDEADGRYVLERMDGRGKEKMRLNELEDALRQSQVSSVPTLLILRRNRVRLFSLADNREKPISRMRTSPARSFASANDGTLCMSGGCSISFVKTQCHGQAKEIHEIWGKRE